MKYQRFEQLPVWKDAARLYVMAERMLDDPAFRGRAALKDQLDRAALSISNNIAEGFERGTTNELLHFIYIARGSAGEVRSMLSIMERLAGLQSHLPTLRQLRLTAEGISRQLRAWADSLQNSDIAGQRYLNDASRAKFERRKRVAAFEAKLDQVRQGKPFIPDPEPDEEGT